MRKYFIPLSMVQKRGENLSFRGLDIEILKADAKRIQLVRLRRSEDGSGHPENGAEG